jgi:hypothetical protein
MSLLSNGQVLVNAFIGLITRPNSNSPIKEKISVRKKAAPFSRVLIVGLSLLTSDYKRYKKRKYEYVTRIEKGRPYVSVLPFFVLDHLFFRAVYPFGIHKHQWYVRIRHRRLSRNR